MDKAIKDQVNYLKNILCEEAREYLQKNPLVGLPVSLLKRSLFTN